MSNRKVSSLQINLTSSNIQRKRFKGFRGKSHRLKTQTSYQATKRAENNTETFSIQLRRTFQDFVDS